MLDFKDIPGAGFETVEVSVPGPDGETMPERQTCPACGGTGSTTILYTAFGGPLAPREPGDPDLPAEERAESEAFWAEHALSSVA